MSEPSNGGSGDVETLNVNDMEVLDEINEEEEEEMIAEVEEKLLAEVEGVAPDIAESTAEPPAAAAPAASTEPAAQENGSAKTITPISQQLFSSENFKIEIRNMPKFFGLAEVKKLLNDTLKLNCAKIKPPPNPGQHNFIFVCFRCEEDRTKALKTLNGYVWKNNKLVALTAKPAPDPLAQKRKQESQSGPAAKLANLNPAEKIKMMTIPFYAMPYEEQLEKKMESIRKSLKSMHKQLWNNNPELRGWLREQEKKYDGMACELKPIRPSPILDEYRNKCEFTIGYHPETNKPTVGFRLGSYISGQVGVYPADDLRHIPQKMKKIAKAFEQHVTASPHAPFHPEKREGVWQTVGVRMTRNGQTMVSVMAHVDALTEPQVDELKKGVLAFFTEGDGKEFAVDSLFFHPLVLKQKGVPLRPPELLHGIPHITEDLMGIKLRISPLAFFQINTAATEELYSVVSELASPTPDTTLLDICCGTGSIGLCLAKDCGQVLGVEIIAPAVEDAKANAKENQLTHCDFFTGAAESVLDSVLVRATRPNFVAVLDPPRPGVPQRVINSIRKCDQVQRLVFMACCTDAAMHNFRDLGRPTSKTVPGNPFLPVCAVPVDLFPHTQHCELVVLFERRDPAALPTVAAEDQGPVIREPTKKKTRGGRKQRQNKPSDGSKPTNGSAGGGGGSSNQGRSAAGGMGRGARGQRSAPPGSLKRLQGPPFVANLKHMKNMGRGMGPFRANFARGVGMPRGRNMPMGGRGPPMRGPRMGPFRDMGPGHPFDRRPFAEPFMAPRSRPMPDIEVLEERRRPMPDIPAEDIGRSWGSRLSRDAFSREEVRRREEEAVQKFKEGFHAALRGNTIPLRDDIFERDARPRAPQRDFEEPRAMPRFQQDFPLEIPERRVPREEMIPASAVSKMLDECRREAESRTLERQRMMQDRREDIFPARDEFANVAERRNEFAAPRDDFRAPREQGSGFPSRNDRQQGGMTAGGAMESSMGNFNRSRDFLPSGNDGYGKPSARSPEKRGLGLMGAAPASAGFNSGNHQLTSPAGGMMGGQAKNMGNMGKNQQRRRGGRKFQQQQRQPQQQQQQPQQAQGFQKQLAPQSARGMGRGQVFMDRQRAPSPTPPAPKLSNTWSQGASGGFNSNQFGNRGVREPPRAAQRQNPWEQRDSYVECGSSPPRFQPSASPPRVAGRTLQAPSPPRLSTRPQNSSNFPLTRSFGNPGQGGSSSLGRADVSLGSKNWQSGSPGLTSDYTIRSSPSMALPSSFQQSSGERGGYGSPSVRINIDDSFSQSPGVRLGLGGNFPPSSGLGGGFTQSSGWAGAQSLTGLQQQQQQSTGWSRRY